MLRDVLDRALPIIREAVRTYRGCDDYSPSDLELDLVTAVNRHRRRLQFSSDERLDSWIAEQRQKLITEHDTTVVSFEDKMRPFIAKAAWDAAVAHPAHPTIEREDLEQDLWVYAYTYKSVLESYEYPSTAIKRAAWAIVARERRRAAVFNQYSYTTADVRRALENALTDVEDTAVPEDVDDGHGWVDAIDVAVDVRTALARLHPADKDVIGRYYVARQRLHSRDYERLRTAIHRLTVQINRAGDLVETPPMTVGGTS